MPGLYLPAYRGGAQAPVPLGPRIAALSNDDRLFFALKKSIDYMPESVGREISSIFSPQTVIVVLSTLTAWALAHFIGIGELMDFILLIVGFGTMGWSVYSLAQELMSFVRGAYFATTEQQLNEAAKHFANAVAMVGVQVILAILLRKPMKKTVANGLPKEWKPSMAKDVGLPRPKLITKLTSKLGVQPDGSRIRGVTDYYGNIWIDNTQTITKQVETFLHESAHRFFAPRIAPLRELRAGLAASANTRVALMKYIEESIAQTYAYFKMNGISLENLKAGFDFPIRNEYVTVTQLAREGKAIGTVVAGAITLTVYLMNKPTDIPQSIASPPVCEMTKPECPMP